MREPQLLTEDGIPRPLLLSPGGGVRVLPVEEELVLDGQADQAGGALTVMSSSWTGGGSPSPPLLPLLCLQPLQPEDINSHHCNPSGEEKAYSFFVKYKSIYLLL